MIKTYIAVIILALAVQIHAESYCSVDLDYDNTKIFTTISEKQDFFLSDYFKGFNLDYKIVLEKPDGEEQLVEVFEDDKIKFVVKNSVQYRDKTSDQLRMILDSDGMIDSKGQGHFVMLTSNQYEFYDVWYGQGSKTISPIFKILNIPDVEDVKCFGVVAIDENTNIVDCIRFQGDEGARFSQNYFYMTQVQGSDHQIVHEVVNNCYLNYRPFTRKTIKYDTSHDSFTQVYIIQGVQFDQMGGRNSGTTEGYLNIFRYVPSETDIGKLTPNQPLTYTSFGLSKELMIADFDCLNEIIYILDHNQGVIFFQYWSNQVKWVKHLLNTPTIQRWAISVTWEGSTIQILIAESNQVKEYHLVHIDDEPYFKNSYPVDHEITGTVALQSNADYIVLQQGMLLTVFNRGQTNNRLVKAQLPDAEQFFLWYSNNLYIFSKDGVYDYYIQDPSIEISAALAKADQEDLIKIRAYSNDLFDSQYCELNLKSVIIGEKYPTGYFVTDYPFHLRQTELSSYQASIPLEMLVIGPDLYWQAEHFYSKQEPAFLEKNKQEPDTNKHTIFEDIPRLAFFEFAEEQTNYWLSTEIVPTKHNPRNFYSIHANYENEMYIFLCIPDYEEPSQVTCGGHLAKIDLISRISSISFGEWGNEDNVMGIVYEDRQSWIYFYYLEGNKVGTEMMIVDINKGQTTSNKVKQITLHSNSLYTVVEGKSSRSVIALSYISGQVDSRATIDENSISDWPSTVESDEWYPEEIIVNTAFPNVIFIRSRKQVYVVSVEEQVPRYLNMIPLNSSVNSKCFVTPRAFVIAYADETIEDLSLQNLNWISMEERFQYPTYDYEFISPFQATSGANTGLIYVLAVQYKHDTLNLKCLVFKSGVNSIQTLYKVVDIENDVTLTGNETLSVGGYEDDYVFIQYGDNKKAYVRASKNPKLIITPHIADQTNYVDDIDIILLVTAMNGTQDIVMHDLTVVNSQLTIFPDEKIIEKAMGDTLYANNEPSHTWEFNTDKWWSGSVLNYEIECSPDLSACGSDITVDQVVQDATQSHQTSVKDIIDIQYHSQSNQIYTLSIQISESGFQMEVRIYDNEMKYERNFNVIPHNWSCDYLQLVNDEAGNLDFVIVYCYDVTSDIKWVAHVLYDENKSDGEQSYELHLTHVEVQREQYQYYKGLLFINSITSDAKQGLYILSLEPQADNIATLIQHYNYLSSEFPSDLRITSFIVADPQPGQSSWTAKLFMSSSPVDDAKDTELYLIDLDTERKYKIHNSIVEFKFLNFVKLHRLFANTETSIEFLKFRDSKVVSAETYEFRIIIMTSNTALYEVSMLFKESEQQIGITDFLENDCKIIHVFNNYGSKLPYKQINIMENTMALAYYDENSRLTSTVFYEMENNLKTYNSDDSDAPLTAFNGGYVYDPTLYDGQDGLLAFALYKKSDNSIGLVSNDLSFDNKLLVLDYFPNRLKINTHGDFERQKVSFILKNEYTTSSMPSFQVYVDPDEFVPIEPDSSSYDYTWVIVVCSLLGVALLGGLIFWLYQKQRRQTDHGNDIASENGYSLQENIIKKE